MSRTPAADLARLKVQHPGWVIRRRVLPGQATRYTAHRKSSRGGFQSLHTMTLAELEQALFLAERDMLDEAGGRRRSRESAAAGDADGRCDLDDSAPAPAVPRSLPRATNPGQ